VQAGLQWLARSQSPDGSWNAAAYGAGTETYALNEFRHATGSRADTAMAGLALLAFLSAGNTHKEGEFRENVQRALIYLIDSQMPSGDMSGPKQAGSDPSVLNSRMYCHSIATLAVAEAYAMSIRFPRRILVAVAGATFPATRAILASSAGKPWHSTACSAPASDYPLK
jgi:hypothetical protein